MKTLVRMVVVTLVAGAAIPSAAAGAPVRRTTTSTLAFALWTQRDDVAPGITMITNWYVEVRAGDGAHSQLLFERIVCEETSGRTPCVTIERRDGTSRTAGRRFSVRKDLKGASLAATFDLQRTMAPGVPVGPPEAVTIRASWSAVDVPERAHGVTSYAGRCAFTQTVRETGIRQRAIATIDGTSIGRTLEARIVRSVVVDERVPC